eukprot:870528-Prorocentrum_minimum.AAC.2
MTRVALQNMPAPPQVQGFGATVNPESHVHQSLQHTTAENSGLRARLFARCRGGGSEVLRKNTLPELGIGGLRVSPRRVAAARVLVGH